MENITNKVDKTERTRYLKAEALRNLGYQTENGKVTLERLDFVYLFTKMKTVQELFYDGKLKTDIPSETVTQFFDYYDGFTPLFDMQFTFYLEKIIETNIYMKILLYEGYFFHRRTADLSYSNNSLQLIYYIGFPKYTLFH